MDVCVMDDFRAAFKVTSYDTLLYLAVNENAARDKNSLMRVHPPM